MTLDQGGDESPVSAKEAEGGVQAGCLFVFFALSLVG